eukprot:395042-Amphidinium_carterae.1
MPFGFKLLRARIVGRDDCSDEVIVAGPSNAGKTCLIERFANDRYIADDAAHGPTLGCDCLQKSVFIDDTEVLTVSAEHDTSNLNLRGGRRQNTNFDRIEFWLKFKCRGCGMIASKVHLYLYDTAGQERFADMAASYYRVGPVQRMLPLYAPAAERKMKLAQASLEANHRREQSPLHWWLISDRSFGDCVLITL